MERSQNLSLTFTIDNGVAKSAGGSALIWNLDGESDSDYDDDDDDDNLSIGAEEVIVESDDDDNLSIGAEEIIVESDDDDDDDNLSIGADQEIIIESDDDDDNLSIGADQEIIIESDDDDDLSIGAEEIIVESDDDDLLDLLMADAQIVLEVHGGGGMEGGAGVEGAAIFVPASGAAVAGLEKRAFVHATAAEGRGAVITGCAICLVDFEDGEEVTAMPCSGGHEFHPDCITKWLGKSNTCPLCRHALSTDVVMDDDEDEDDVEWM